MQGLPHPTEVGAIGELVHIEETRPCDARWHYRFAARGPIEAAPTDGAVPAAAEARRLAWYRAGDVPLELEVVGVGLEREVDAADVLDAWLAHVQPGLEIASRKPVRLRGGQSGDVVGSWEHEGDRRAGRFLATKWGPRLFVLAVRAPLAAYARLANDVFAMLASFEPLDDGLGVLAEPLRAVARERPVPWRTAVPDGWLVLPALEEGTLAGVQAANVDPFGVVRGRLALGVATRDRARSPRAAAALWLDLVRGHGLALEGETFAEEPARPPFEQSWLLATRARRDDAEAELRCRVLLHPDVWAVGGALGPAADEDREAWMQNKRALDLVTELVRLERP
jgi:hypothetical protein